MVKEIRELMTLVSNESKKESIHAEISKLSKQRRRFIRLACDKPDSTDQEICEELYGLTSTSRYSKLKRRTYFNLLDILFFSTNVNIKIGQEISQRRARCIRQTATLRLLSLKQAQLNILKLSKMVLKEARELEMLDLALDSLVILMAHYGMTEMNPTIFKKYKGEYDKLIEIKKIEDMLQIASFSLYATYAENISNPEAIKYDYTLERLNNIIESNLSFKSTLYANRIICLRHEIQKDFFELEKSAERAIKSLKIKLELGKQSIMFFIRQKFIAQLKLKNSESILRTLKEMEDFVKPNTYHFFVIGVFKIIMHFHNRDYNEAIQMTYSLESKKASTNLPASFKEFLRVISGYSSFVLSINPNLQVEAIHDRKFNVFKLLNEVPHFQKEKRGLNISVLLLHIMVLLEKRKHDSIIDRIDALNQYAYRYLRKDDTFRSNCFIKMIIQMTKADFHPIRTERYTTELLEKLKSVPLELSEQPLEVEIIPYEDLWEMVMTLLERNSKIKRGRPKKIMN